MATISRRSARIENGKAGPNPGKRRAGKSNPYFSRPIFETILTGLVISACFVFVLVLYLSGSFQTIAKNLRRAILAETQISDIDLVISRDQRIIYVTRRSDGKEIGEIALKSQKDQSYSHKEFFGAWVRPEHFEAVFSYKNNGYFRLGSADLYGTSFKVLRGSDKPSLGDIQFSENGDLLSYRFRSGDATCESETDLIIMNLDTGREYRVPKELFLYDEQVERGARISTRISEYLWESPSSVSFYNRPVVCLEDGRIERLEPRHYSWDFESNELFELFPESEVIL